MQRPWPGAAAAAEGGGPVLAASRSIKVISIFALWLAFGISPKKKRKNNKKNCEKENQVGHNELAIRSSQFCFNRIKSTDTIESHRAGKLSIVGQLIDNTIEGVKRRLQTWAHENNRQ